MKTIFHVAAVIIILVAQKTHGQSLSQQVIASAGNFTLSGGNSLSYTAGEAVVQTAITPTNILTQGFQQPNDVYALAVENIITPVYQIDVYPNPTQDNVFVKFPSTDLKQGFMIRLTNMIGQVLVETKNNVTGISEVNIPMSGFAAGTYLLNITDENKNTSTYKIIKLN